MSATGWALAQFGVTQWMYEYFVAATGVPVPFNETGSFDTLAWQFLWFVGLWLGADRTVRRAQPIVFPRWLVVGASAVALSIFCWRHFGAGGQAPFGDDMALNLLFDKWRLGPLRLVDLAALCVVTIQFGPRIAEALPRPRWLEDLGAASLTVFCGHLVVVLLVFAISGNSYTVRPWWGDALLLAAVFGGLHALARGVQAWERRPRLA